MAVQTVFSIQELCDHLCYYISLHSTSQDDLKSTALVCQNLCISAQSRIFRHLTLDPSQSPRGYVHSSESRREAAESASCRLAGLRATPRLLGHVRHLTVLAQAGVLKPVLDTGFPLLQKISFNFIDTDLSPDDHDLTRDCVALPLICELELMDLRTTGVRYHHFASLFDTRTQHLDSVALLGIQPTGPPPTASVPPSTEHRIRINRLRLFNTNLEAWFMSPSCPFDFTHLLEVETDSGSSGMLHILTSARLSITRLRIDHDGIDLSIFPGLKCLELWASWHMAISSLKPDNCVERLVFRVALSSFNAEDLSRIADECSQIDTLIVNTPMPALQRVEMMNIHDAGPKLQRIKPYFSQLVDRQLLVLTNNA
ncbi:hypothetical protein FB451DRAFT_1553771 [Mycena latifolia]|nr:hypothetical protein FB451DRAFT_1553771 [Mycena latifolia]